MRMVNSKIIFEFLRNLNFSLLATLGSKENLEFTIRVKVLLTTKYCQSRPFALRWSNFKSNSTSVRNVYFKNTSWGSGLTVSTQIQIKCCRNFYCVIHCLQKKIFHAKSKDLLTDGAPLKEPLERAQPGSQDLAMGRGPHRKLSNWSPPRPWQWRAFCEDPCRWWSLGGGGGGRRVSGGRSENSLLGGRKKIHCRWERGERKEKWNFITEREQRKSLPVGGGWGEGVVKTLLLEGSKKIHCRWDGWREEWTHHREEHTQK